ncbi:MAG: hypothetical protein WC070_01020 [Candidatus Magasanikbacteria bacterium]
MYKRYLFTVLASFTLLGAGCTSSININTNSFFDKKVEVEDTSLKVGSAVFAEWKDKTWYKGTINATCEGGFDVLFLDNTNKCVTELQILRDKLPNIADLQVGSKVIAKWTANAYYDAEIIKVNPNNFTVRYYDKLERDVVLDEIILDNRVEVRGTVELQKTSEIKTSEILKDNFKAGDKVIAEWMTSNSLYSATIIGICEKGLNIKYYDNAEKCLATSQIVIDLPAEKDTLAVGTKVLVRDSNTNNFFAGEISKIVGTNYETKFLIYGDEAVKVLPISQLRLDTRK